MCRSTDYRTFIDRGRLKIRSFSIHFSGGPQPGPSRPLPDSLTLLYLPRLSEHSLLVDGSEIRPDSPAFITLHRAVSPCSSNLYASRERIVAGEGLRFDVYMREDRVLKGVFRKEEDGEWRLECKCTMETDAVREGTVAEVCVAAEGGVAAMGERMQMVVRRRKGKGLGFGELEEIPEEREVEEEEGGDEMWDGGDCCCHCGGGLEGEMGMEGGDLTEEEMKMMAMMEANRESVKWAVDVGIWVMCFGVGFLVSKASARSLRRMRRLL